MRSRNLIIRIATGGALAAIVVPPIAGCRRPGPPPAPMPAAVQKTTAPAAPVESIPPETSVMYTPMIDAYDAGNVAEARRLARQYLDIAERELTNATNDLSRETGVRLTLNILRSMLIAERRLAAPNRFANDQELADFVEQKLYLARDAAPTIVAKPDVKAYIDREMGVVAADWILSRRDTADAATLNADFADFAPQLKLVGYDDLADLQNSAAGDAGAIGNPLSVQPLATGAAADFDQTELNAIHGVVQAYFKALKDRDAAGLRKVVNIKASDVAALFAEADHDIEEAGIKTIDAVTIPPLIVGQTGIRANTTDAARFEVTISGVEVAVTRINGEAEQISMSKIVKLRREESGRWWVLPPRRG